jgi:Arylsulfatase A and related enzymes
MERRPDILWIVTTQWRAGACGYAGDPNARTPWLDRLAAESVNYAQAVTPHPFGPFARAALLTGVESPANGVREYFDPLPQETRTIAHELGERGYETAFWGKWHLARREPEAALVGEAHARMVVPEEARGGFEFWEGFESGFLLNDPWLHGTRLAEPVKFSGYQSDVVCGRAAEWIGNRGAERSWFCVVSLEAPHPPYGAAVPAGVERREEGEVVLAANVPRGGEVEAKARRELAGYHAHIQATDTAVGRLIAAADEAAERAGRARPVVVFTSVHGDMHGAHGLFRKGWPHEESVRVPLLVRGAGAKRGEKCDAPVSLVELFGATRAWAEGRRDELGRREFSRISMPSVVAVPQQCDRVWRGVRTRERKLVLNADGTPWLLFDLANDPGELRNLADDAGWREELERLKAWVGDEVER